MKILLSIVQRDKAIPYPSKSGVHIITGPFNPNLVQPPKDIEFKKDAMMLLKF